jgi:hypothetical protein
MIILDSHETEFINDDYKATGIWELFITIRKQAYLRTDIMYLHNNFKQLHACIRQKAAAHI